MITLFMPCSFVIQNVYDLGVVTNQPSLPAISIEIKELATVYVQFIITAILGMCGMFFSYKSNGIIMY